MSFITDEENATEDEDKEYDYMAENHKEEKEEYRNDRAVRIPSKETIFHAFKLDYLYSGFSSSQSLLNSQDLLNLFSPYSSIIVLLYF